MQRMTHLTVLFIVMMSTIFTSFAVNAEDKRKTLVLTGDEREHVLTEMRGFLESVQSILAATSQGDMTSVAAAARKSGFAGQGGAPASLREKLPMQFKKLGMSTHQSFDQLALDAEAMEDADQVIEQLGNLMQNCVACHQTFRIKVQATADSPLNK